MGRVEPTRQSFLSHVDKWRIAERTPLSWDSSTVDDLEASSHMEVGRDQGTFSIDLDEVGSVATTPPGVKRPNAGRWKAPSRS